MNDTPENNARIEPVTQYLERVRAALTDLPGGEVEEILADVGPHVQEVYTELDAADPDRTPDAAALAARLGEPEAYATELRHAGDYPPPPAQPTAASRVRQYRVGYGLLIVAVVLAAFVGVAGGIGGSQPWYFAFPLAVVAAVVGYALTRSGPGLGAVPEYRWLRESLERSPAHSTLVMLQPVWWVARAIIAAILVLLLLGLATGVPLLILAIVFSAGSILLARRTARSNGAWFLVAPLNAFAAGIGLLLVLSPVGLSGSSSYVESGYYPPEQSFDVGNIYVFDEDGNPLSEVYLYDEYGAPLNVPDYSCRYEIYDSTVDPIPENLYPRPRYEIDDVTGRCREVPGLPFSVAIPKGSTLSPSTSRSPSSSGPSPSTPPSSVPVPTSETPVPAPPG